MNQFFRVSMIFESASRSPNFLTRFLFDTTVSLEVHATSFPVFKNEYSRYIQK